MDGGQHGPPAEKCSYHHLPSKPIRHTSPLDMPLASLSEKSLSCVPFGAQSKWQYYWKQRFEIWGVDFFASGNSGAVDRGSRPHTAAECQQHPAADRHQQKNGGRKPSFDQQISGDKKSDQRQHCAASQRRNVMSWHMRSSQSGPRGRDGSSGERRPCIQRVSASCNSPSRTTSVTATKTVTLLQMTATASRSVNSCQPAERKRSRSFSCGPSSGLVSEFGSVTKAPRHREKSGRPSGNNIFQWSFWAATNVAHRRLYNLESVKKSGWASVVGWRSSVSAANPGRASTGTVLRTSPYKPKVSASATAIQGGCPALHVSQSTPPPQSRPRSIARARFVRTAPRPRARH